MRFELVEEIINTCGEHGGWLIIERGSHPKQYPQYYHIKIENPYRLVKKELAKAAVRGMNEFYNAAKCDE